MHRWRLLLVDDHALFREGLAGLFAYQDDFLLVGEAGDAQTALAQTAALRPDLVLMDIDLPGEDGIATTRRLKAEFPDVTVVMLTVHDATDKLLEAIKAGAQGYLVKNIRSAELLEQLRGLSSASTRSRIISRRSGASRTCAAGDRPRTMASPVGGCGRPTQQHSPFLEMY